MYFKQFLHYLENHLFQYLLIFLLFAITVSSLVSPIATTYKVIFISMTILVYFVWTIWHHWENHTASTAVFLEYFLLIAILYWVLLNLAY